MPRPGLQVMARYTSCTHMDRSPLLYVHVGLPVQPTKTALTFALLTLKVVSESRVTWATSVPILVFLGLSVLELGPMYVTDRQTSGGNSSITVTRISDISHKPRDTLVQIQWRHEVYDLTKHTFPLLCHHAKFG